jgi:hypothetical protein
MKKTRKPIALLLSVLMVLALFAPLSVVSFAEGDEPAVVASGDCGKNGNNMLYTLYSDGTMVLSGSGQMKYYQYAGNAPWKDYRDSIRYLVVQPGVKTISSHAFEYAKNLESVSLPDGFEYIGEWTFAGCYKLESINFPSSLKTIIDYAFHSCRSLKTVNIQGSVTKIPSLAFYQCYKLESVTLPATVQTISESAFAGCLSLHEINLPDGLTTIEGGAFSGCALTSLSWPDSITTIGNGAFGGCSGLPSTLPANLETIGELAFQDCKMESVTLPDHVVSVGRRAFARITNLQTVEIPASVTSIDSTAFSDCTALTSFSVAADNQSYKSENGVLFTKDGATLVDYPAGKTDETYDVPAGVTEIAPYGFDCNRYLKNLTLPDGLTTIGTFAFYGCSGLSAMAIPEGVTQLPGFSFSGCSALATLTLPESLETIGTFEFDGCRSLRAVKLPAVKKIGHYAFGMCKGLEQITLTPALTNISEGAFSGCEALTDVYYLGTTAQWNAKTVDATANDYFLNATVHLHDDHCYEETILSTPTCTQAGTAVYTCFCGDTYTNTIPGEHNYDDGVITVYPTETTDGEIRYTCTKCGDTYTDTVPATPYQDWLYTESYPTGNGQIGEHVYYTTYYDGHVSIYGEGETYPTSHYVPYDYYYHPIGGNPTSIEVHEGVTGLMCKGMFCNYPQLEYVKLPASLTYIESMVFDTIQVLTAVDVAAANPSYTSQNGILFNKDMTELLLYPSGKTENSYTVPDGVEIIGEMAFHKNPVLKTVTLPDSVKEIGNTAFNSSVLETVNLGNGLETIERFAFSNCKNLESIRIPTSVKFIGRGVFQFDDNFKNVYFTCTQAEWDAIEIGEWNEPLQEANRTYGGHTYDEGVITTPATCGEAGVRTYTCIYCGGTRTETIPATGEHAYNGGVITTPATCEADGVKAFTCTGCGGSYTETIPATGHDWSDWIVTRPATETREGEAYRFCKNDPSHVEHMTIDKLPTTYEEEQSLGDRIMDWLRDFFDKIGELFQSLFIFW